MILNWIKIGKTEASYAIVYLCGLLYNFCFLVIDVCSSVSSYIVFRNLLILVGRRVSSADAFVLFESTSERHLLLWVEELSRIVFLQSHQVGNHLNFFSHALQLTRKLFLNRLNSHKTFLLFLKHFGFEFPVDFKIQSSRKGKLQIIDFIFELWFPYHLIKDQSRLEFLSYQFFLVEDL